MDVSSIPATFDATARFNVSNAMHAIVAAYLSGTDMKLIGTAMCNFHTSYESTPGRLNIFNDLPFPVVMDFAHNPDGIRSLCDFVDRQTVSGRKVVAFAGSANRTDETLKNIARYLAGHFDFYFCKEHEPFKDLNRRTVAHILRQSLLESGVAENQIAVREFGKDVIFEIFDACEPGDLLVMLMGHVEKHKLPLFITEYAGTDDSQVTHGD